MCINVIPVLLFWVSSSAKVFMAFGIIIYTYNYIHIYVCACVHMFVNVRLYFCFNLCIFKFVLLWVHVFVCVRSSTEWKQKNKRIFYYHRSIIYKRVTKGKKEIRETFVSQWPFCVNNCQIYTVPYIIYCCSYKYVGFLGTCFNIHVINKSLGGDSDEKIPLMFLELVCIQ